MFSTLAPVFPSVILLKLLWVRYAKAMSSSPENLSSIVPDLNPVTYFEGLPDENEQPPGKIRERVLQGNSQTCRQKTEVSAQGIKSAKPDKCKEKDKNKCRTVCSRFSPEKLFVFIMGKPEKSSHQYPTKKNKKD